MRKKAIYCINCKGNLRKTLQMLNPASAIGVCGACGTYYLIDTTVDGQTGNPVVVMTPLGVDILHNLGFLDKRLQDGSQTGFAPLSDPTDEEPGVKGLDADPLEDMKKKIKKAKTAEELFSIL